MENEVWLIDAKPIVQFIMNGLNNPDKMKALGHDAIEILAEIEYAPIVDAVPVVHGRWLYDSGSGKYFCSACDEDALSFKKDTLYGGDLYEVCLTDYCPNCGAKMDLEE